MARRIVLILVLSFLALTLYIVGVRAANPEPIVVYYNRACADCLHYIQETVIPLLRQAGYEEPIYKAHK
jgi:hypothetical protein